MPNSRPLRTVLALRFAAVCLLPGILLAVLVWVFLLPRMEQRVVEAHGALAEILAVETERYLQQPVAALKGLAEVARAIPEKERGAHIGRLLQAQLRGTRTLAGVFVLDARGVLTDIALPPDAQKLAANYLGIDLSGNPVASAAHRKGQQIWSAVYLSGVTEQITVAATVPMGNSLLVGEIGLDALSSFVREVTTSASMQVMVIDNRGQVVAHPDPLIARQQLNIGRLPILDQVSRQEEGHMITARFDFNGQAVIGAARRIAGTDWTVLILEPRAEVRKPVWELIVALALAAALAAVIATLMALFMAAGFSLRFSRLTRLAQELAAGRYPESWPESQVTEAIELIGSVRQMADAVQEREVALRKLNDSLEQRVADRTAELQRTNHELSAALRRLEQAQNELLQSEKMAALGSLVAGVAHELNTPIGNSLMVASTLQDRTEEFEADVAAGLRRSSLNRHIETNREASGALVRNLQRAAELITSFKQVAVDRTTSQRRRFALDALVGEVVLTLSPTMRNKPWQLHAEIPPGIRMDSYPGPLGQVLTNLINNAVLHGFDGCDTGNIHIDARLTEAGDHVRMSVTDDGLGIPSDVIGRVFDPFFTTRMGRGGTGLGLSICHNIVKGVLGGQVSVESVPGEGTSFILILPLVAPEHAEDASAIC